jgi:hypothetical protein
MACTTTYRQETDTTEGLSGPALHPRTLFNWATNRSPAESAASLPAGRQDSPPPRWKRPSFRQIAGSEPVVGQFLHGALRRVEGNGGLAGLLHGRGSARTRGTRRHSAEADESQLTVIQVESHGIRN